MALDLAILYRGPLSSCNYGCSYCPFAKRRESAIELRADRDALDRFVAWASGREGDRLSVLFTPWGEALIRRRYREAIARLSHLPQVARVAIQTNLAFGPGWVDRCDLDRLALWATYHPSEVSRADFVARCLELDRKGVRFSVGIVGLKEHLAEAEALRRALPAHVYLWVNAYKPGLSDLAAEEGRRFEAIDPMYPINTVRHPSLGRSCRTGRSVVSVDGDGTMRRCHFIREPIGNLYDDGFEEALRERSCANATCSCHIGYVHLDALELGPVFGEGILERIPAGPIWRRSSAGAPVPGPF